VIGSDDSFSSTLSASSSRKNLRPQISRAASIQNEMDSYLQIAELPLSDDTIHEWSPVATFFRKYEKLCCFPLVCQLAKNILSAPATSVYSERLFSEMGSIYEKKRSRLRPDCAESLLFLHHNMVRYDQYREQREGNLDAGDIVSKVRDRKQEEQQNFDGFDN
jgi:hypothetical protein